MEMDRLFVRVNKYIPTSLPNVYAAGDLITNWQLAHVASTEGLVAASSIADQKTGFLC